MNAAQGSGAGMVFPGADDQVSRKATARGGTKNGDIAGGSQTASKTGFLWGLVLAFLFGLGVDAIFAQLREHRIGLLFFVESFLQLSLGL